LAPITAPSTVPTTIATGVFLVGGARADYAADRAAKHRADCRAIAPASMMP